MGSGGIVIFIVFLAIAIAAAIYGALAAKRRREELSALAVRLGLRFDPKDNHELAKRFSFLDHLFAKT